MKSFSVAAVAAALASTAVGAPLERRQAVDDATILNYALTLEHLENNFYMDGLRKFSQADFQAAGFDATFYKNIMQVSKDESAHVAFLTTALKAAGAPAVAACTYNFPMNDVKTFITTASVLEGVGVSAYLGAAADIASKKYLTAAGSILTTEARHSSYIRAGLDYVPFGSPFDVPLGLNEVYTLAAPFIASCPSSNPTLPVKAFPGLTMDPAQTMPLMTNQKATFDSAAPLPTTPGIYGAWFTVNGPIVVAALVSPDGMKVTVPVPDAIGGQNYVAITTSKDMPSDENIIAGPGIVEVAAV